MKTSSHSWLMTGIGEPLVCKNLTPAAPKENQVTVEVAGCGVCHTDLGYLYDGVRPNHELPLTLGHEISGRVVQAGKDASRWLGKAVIIPSVIPCGECDLCRSGLGNICRSQKMPGNDIHGGFADYVTVPAYGLCDVDEDLLDKSGMTLADVSVVADAVTTPFQAIKLAQVSPGDLAVVIGVGGVGGYAVQIARAMGATVVAVDVDAGKLDKIAKYGAAYTINSSKVDAKNLKKEVQAFAKENNLPATRWKIFECSGIAAGQMTAFSLLTYGAHIAIVGFTLDKTQVRLSNLMAYNARMQGNWGCVPEYYPEALNLALSGKVEMKPFVHQYPLDEINSVMEAVHSHAVSERPILVP